MGLELGPPWLVLVEQPNSAQPNIIFRDNFTGAGLQRVITARKREPQAVAAVMDRANRLARHSDGRVYDPIEETKGRNYGTPADRGHRAQLTAIALFRAMDGRAASQCAKQIESESEIDNADSKNSQFAHYYALAVAFFALIMAINIISQ